MYYELRFRYNIEDVYTPDDEIVEVTSDDKQECVNRFVDWFKKRLKDFELSNIDFDDDHVYIDFFSTTPIDNANVSTVIFGKADGDYLSTITKNVYYGQAHDYSYYEEPWYDTAEVEIGMDISDVELLGAEDYEVNVNETLEENSNRYRRVKRALFGDDTGKIKTFAIISPENPLGWKDSDDETFKSEFLKWTANPKLYNKDKLAEIKSDELLHKIKKTGDITLKYGGFNYAPLKGKYEDTENSFIVFNIPYADAEAIARNYGQESFFFGKPNASGTKISYYKTSDACKTYQLVETTSVVTNEADAENFFSKFGLKFRINMQSFGDDVESVTDIEAFEESFDEHRPFKSRAEQRRSAYKKDAGDVTKGVEMFNSAMGESAYLTSRPTRYKVYYNIHANQVLEGGSNDIREAEQFAKDCIDRLASNPWEDKKSLIDAIDSVMIYDHLQEEDVTTSNIEKYSDIAVRNLLSK